MRSLLRFGAVSAVLASGILGAAAGTEASPAPTPIAVSGWNRDVVIGDTTNYYANNFYGSASGAVALVENGATTATGSGGAAFTGGLPAEAFDSTVNFSSSYTNTVTGGNTVFQFQPFDTTGTESGTPSDNVLGLTFNGAANSGALTLTTPAEFSSLAVLATVVGGPSNGTGGYTITFSDNSTVSGTYTAIDWTTTSTPSAYAMTDLAKSLSPATGGANPTWAVDATNIYLFETDINLSGVLTSDGASASTLAIDSITFTGNTNLNAYTGIFALSGTPVPEPASVALLSVVSLGLLARRRRR